MKLQRFCGNIFLGDFLQNMFFYQSTFDMLDLKIDKGNGYVTDWKSKGLPESELFQLHAFLPNIKYLNTN